MLTILEIRKLSKQFGGLTAVEDVNFDVKHGEITGLIGPNGAGKTTVFNLITGFHKPTSGEIVFLGTNISYTKPHAIARLGLLRTFQFVSLLDKQTVYENVRLAHHLQCHVGGLASIIRTKRAREVEMQIHKKTVMLLEKMGLYEFKDQQAGVLPHGLKKVLGLAIAIAGKPKCLLLDEVTAGLSREETQMLITHILGIRDEGVDVVIVEHDMKVIMSICERIVVLNFGRKIAEGTPNEISQNADVISAYLGFRRNDAQGA